MKQRNYVAKHATTYNKSSIQIDRKKAAKRGAQKHKGRYDSNVCFA